MGQGGLNSVEPTVTPPSQGLVMTRLPSPLMATATNRGFVGSPSVTPRHPLLTVVRRVQVMPSGLPVVRPETVAGPFVTGPPDVAQVLSLESLTYT